MKKTLNSVLFLFVVLSIFLNACSPQNQLPLEAEQALAEYWESLPTGPKLTYRILQAWPGNVPSRTEMPWDTKAVVWCVESEIVTADDPTVIGVPVTWIVIWNDKKSEWDAMMLAAMSSTWPYEACGKDL